LRRRPRQGKRGVKHCPLQGAALPVALRWATEHVMTSIFEILMLILNIAQWIILVHIIMSWLINFQVLNLRQPLVAQIWDGLNRLLEPIYSRVRAILPSMGGVDLAPLLVLVAIYALRIVLQNNAAAFY